MRLIENSDGSTLCIGVVGSGASAASPIPSCLATRTPEGTGHYDKNVQAHLDRLSDAERDTPRAGQWCPSGAYPSNVPCPSCRESLHPDVPDGWKNARGNPSILVLKRFANGSETTLLVDMGKSHNDKARQFFPHWGVTCPDAIIITHPHAFMGFDETRELFHAARRSIPTYATRGTRDKIGKAFRYLMLDPVSDDTTAAVGTLPPGGTMPTLEWHLLDGKTNVDIGGIDVELLTLHHGKRKSGEPSECLGFMFDKSVVYLSDLHALPDKTLAQMQTALGGRRPDLTIIDMLRPFPGGYHSHVALAETLDILMWMNAGASYTLGITQPTTHFVLEELYRSLADPDGSQPHVPRQFRKLASGEFVEVYPADEGDHDEAELTLHPSEETARRTIAAFWDQPKSQKLRPRLKKWIESGGSLHPLWDGLVLRIGGQGQDSTCVEVPPGADGFGSVVGRRL